MKFKITCDNCDYEFLTTGEGRQTVQCQCPHCGGQMKVHLPDVPEEAGQSADSEPSATEQPARQGEKSGRAAHNKGCLILAVLLFVGFLTVLGFMVAYSLSSRDTAKPIDDPFERAYEDTTNYEDVYEETVADRPDTTAVVETPRWEEPDTIAEEPQHHHSAPTENAEPAAPAEEPAATEPAPSTESPTNIN